MPGPWIHSDALPSSFVPTPVPSPTGPKPETGLGAPVATAIELLSGLVSTLDPGRLTGPDAAELYSMLAAVERLSMAAKTLLAPRIDESGIWRDRGHRSPAAMLAEVEGVPLGQARNTLEVGHRLPELPGTEEALRSGTLSGPKVAEVSGAAMLDPETEGSLLAGAADRPLAKIKERCQRARFSAGTRDPLATVRRIHAARRFGSWFDADGTFCFEGRDTPDRGAKILEQMNHTVARLREADRAARTAAGAPDQSDPPEEDRALRADAFFLLVTGRTPTGQAPMTVDDDDPGPPDEHIASRLAAGLGVPDQPNKAARGAPDEVSGGNAGGGGRTGLPPPGGSQHDVIDRPPTCSLMVRVDLDALFRGSVESGEVCEIDNQGPIPVAMARDLASDSFLRLVFHRAGDIRAVSHLGRTINRRLRTALAHRDRCCVVPGCGVPYGLEIDHVVPFASGGPTELDNPTVS